MEETEGYEKKNTLEILTYRVDRVWFLSKLKHFHVIIHPWQIIEKKLTWQQLYEKLFKVDQKLKSIKSRIT